MLKSSITRQKVKITVTPLLMTGASNEEVRRLAREQCGIMPSECTLARWRKEMGVKAKTTERRKKSPKGKNDGYFEKEELEIISRFNNLFGLMKPRVELDEGDEIHNAEVA